MERRNEKKHSRMIVSRLSYKQTKKKTATTTLDDVPTSLVLEILHRLDIKSAIRCKSVSKQWCSVVSDPSFARYFYHHHHHWPFTLVLRYVTRRRKYGHLLLPLEEEPYFESLPYVPPIYQHHHYEVNIQASCHDLFFCSCSAVCGDSPLIYYVINPLTGQWTALPPLPDQYTTSERPQVGFICNYDILNHKLSFRAMIIPEFRGVSAEFKVQIFSSDTSKWSESVVLCPAPHRFESDFFAFPAVPYNGLLFWWSGNDSLVGFDPYNSGCCQFFQKPLKLDPSHGIERLGVCHGALRISQISGSTYDYSDPVLRVWELKDFDKDKGGGGGKWCLEHRLYVNQMVSEKSPWLTEYVIKKNPALDVLAYHPNDRDIMYLMIHYYKVVSCNLRRKTMEVVPDLQHLNFFYSGNNVFNFVLPCWPTPIHSSPYL